jgi:hypothetical protein
VPRIFIHADAPRPQKSKAIGRVIRNHAVPIRDAWSIGVFCVVPHPHPGFAADTHIHCGFPWAWQLPSG